MRKRKKIRKEIQLDADTSLIDEWNAFVEFNNDVLSEQEAAALENALIEITRYAVGAEDISESDVRGFLASLGKAQGKPSKTSPNSQGMTPLEPEKATRRFLATLVVAKHPDAFDNDKAFGASSYKQFSRRDHNYGHDNIEFNNQKNRYAPLANPTLRVQEAYMALDSVGLGNPMHWRVVNTMTGEYATRQIHREQAEEIAADLSRDFEQILAEQGDGDGSVNPPPAKLKKLKKTTVNLAPKLKTELATTELRESLLRPLSAERQARIEAALHKQNSTWSGSVATTTDEKTGRTVATGMSQSTTVSDWKAGQALLSERRKREANEKSELTSIQRKRSR